MESIIELALEAQSELRDLEVSKKEIKRRRRRQGRRGEGRGGR